ncbi:amidohydrolase family protein [Nonomuraea phyllanthi]|uniref:N-acyl-D-amino-acid deacylase family protein n=1 Tax=Nonomuraea phyllanthi TaxID=2219224 RepID=UPI001293EB1D|nr:D-aminoacylase [Nonomuraea phyllanthi]QFY08924.1 amidohydrolase family protein [Nonomuraea phyllanthi]
MVDLILRGGTVYDGLGAPGFVGDVAISGGRIVAVGGNPGGAPRVLDVTGLAVAPGFVDAHAHSDLVPLMAEPQPFKLLQGVTTEINGNCGFSYAPDASRLEELTGESVPDWTFAQYLEAVAAAGPANHVATLVGHSTLRGAVAGFAETLADGDLERMRDLAAQAFEAGACGLSSGLIYPPGSYAGTDELVALAEVAHRYGVPYTTHMRDEGSGLAAALDEAIEIARRADVRLQVSHCKVAGRRNHGQAGMLLARLRAARAAGVDVRGDQYPYLAGSTVLAALLPPSALAGGHVRDLLASPGERARLRDRAEAGGTGAGLWQDATPDGVLVTGHAEPSFAGRSLAAITADPSLRALTGVPEEDAWEVACALIAADPAATMVISLMDERDMVEIMADPLIGVGSDNGSPAGLEHPRTWGCFPRFLGAYVRERQVVPWEEAVRKMTSATADQFRLTGRGRLAPGAWADVCVFDPDTVGHAGTYAEPAARPSGIVHVLLDGHLVVEHGEFTGERRGRVLRPS